MQSFVLSPFLTFSCHTYWFARIFLFWTCSRLFLLYFFFFFLNVCSPHSCSCWEKSTFLRRAASIFIYLFWGVFIASVLLVGSCAAFWLQNKRLSTGSLVIELQQLLNAGQRHRGGNITLGVFACCPRISLVFADTAISSWPQPF